MDRKGIVLVLSGPSGVGKDAVRERFREVCPQVRHSVSATTRPMRPGETHGVDYFFLTPAGFEEMIRRGEFLEHTLYNGNHYGTPAPFIRQMLDKGQDVLLKIEVQGALNVKKFFPEAVLVFMVPPTMRELWQRMEGRHTDGYESRVARFQLAYRELGFADQYDYIIVNDCLDDTVDHVRAIYLAEKSRRSRAACLYETLTQEVVET